MKALVGAFNQEKALVGAFSVIVKLTTLPTVPSVLTDTGDVDAEEAEQAHSAHQAQPRSLAGDTPHWSWPTVPSPFTTLGTLKADVGNPSRCPVSCVMADGKSPAVGRGEGPVLASWGGGR